MKIYTKTGDCGQTSLSGGQRVDKDCQEMQALGEIDELNTQVGFLLALVKTDLVKKELEDIQNNLFVIGAQLAAVQTPLNPHPRLSVEVVKFLEEAIDHYQKLLPELHHFILPGGVMAASQCFVVRAVCRRAERQVVQLSRKYELPAEIGQYLNRLSDYFFVLARFLNQQENQPEKIWTGDST